MTDLTFTVFLLCIYCHRKNTFYMGHVLSPLPQEPLSPQFSLIRLFYVETTVGSYHASQGACDENQPCNDQMLKKKNKTKKHVHVSPHPSGPSASFLPGMQDHVSWTGTRVRPISSSVLFIRKPVWCWEYTSKMAARWGASENTLNACNMDFSQLDTVDAVKYMCCYIVRLMPSLLLSFPGGYGT